MLLVCPHCEAQFQVADAAIGNGRTVRCARCRGSWFAQPEPVFAEAEAAAPAVAATEPSFGVEAAPIQEDDFAAASEVTDSPPLAADIEVTPDGRATPDAAAPHVISEIAERKAWQLPRFSLRNYKLPRPVAIVFVAAIAAIITIIGPRESIVRLMPDLAGGYAAIGLPVNLRGLEFRGVKTVQEVQDGIPVLVIEGEVVNITQHPVEVPRVRIAVLGPGKQELYSWTTLLQRSVLADNEKVSFRSRLASPPPNGQEVLVRFLTRADLTGS
ncbi:MAG TPA: zinc-ribbon domain-containing protein [Xanthobacteraceae bacterium]|nr:zinc-ribbon domain-containing protein [Xanthobacteraceae bacterium]